MRKLTSPGMKKKFVGGYRTFSVPLVELVNRAPKGCKVPYIVKKLCTYIEHNGKFLSSSEVRMTTRPSALSLDFFLQFGPRSEPTECFKPFHTLITFWKCFFFWKRAAKEWLFHGVKRNENSINRLVGPSMDHVDFFGLICYYAWDVDGSEWKMKLNHSSLTYIIFCLWNRPTRKCFLLTP